MLKGLKLGMYFCLIVFFFASCASNETGNLTSGKDTETSDIIAFRQNMITGAKAAKDEKYEQALKYFYKAEEIRPEDENAIRFIGQTLYHLEKPEEAIAYFNKLKDINPYEYRAYAHLGMIYRNLFEYKKSIEYFEKTLELKNNDKSAIANLADIHFKLKEFSASYKYILLFEKIINKENILLLPQQERIKIKKATEKFSHYKSVIKKAHPEVFKETMNKHKEQKSII
ncbi:tetratricopeptide repeat domain protein [Desulfosarcina variabilis str. Montpellier]|uniref:tetratricopeptide repeat protein n=1 Tax=Desulfosarcina variabilis TaxID=2300 RepID=UPI003AFA116C